MVPYTHTLETVQAISIGLRIENQVFIGLRMTVAILKFLLVSSLRDIDIKQPCLQNYRKKLFIKPCTAFNNLFSISAFPQKIFLLTIPSSKTHAIGCMTGINKMGSQLDGQPRRTLRILTDPTVSLRVLHQVMPGKDVADQPSYRTQDLSDHHRPTWQPRQSTWVVTRESSRRRHCLAITH